MQVCAIWREAGHSGIGRRHFVSIHFISPPVQPSAEPSVATWLGHLHAFSVNAECCGGRSSDCGILVLRIRAARDESAATCSLLPGVGY